MAALDSAVISVTQMHAGDAYNVIPQEAVLRGTIRAFQQQRASIKLQRSFHSSAIVAPPSKPTERSPGLSPIDDALPVQHHSYVMYLCVTG